MSTVSWKHARNQMAAPEQPGSLRATVVRLTPEGEVLVDWIGNSRGPIKAGILLPGSRHEGFAAGDTVLLLVPEPSGEPVILGKVADRLPSATPAPTDGPAELDVSIDGRRVVLSAHDEIVLRCGVGSITLSSDGRIVVKGTEIVSRASGANKIKGAMVNIN